MPESSVSEQAVSETAIATVAAAPAARRRRTFISGNQPPGQAELISAEVAEANRVWRNSVKKVNENVMAAVAVR
jgi:hypothetical protein